MACTAQKGTSHHRETDTAFVMTVVPNLFSLVEANWLLYTSLPPAFEHAHRHKFMQDLITKISAFKTVEHDMHASSAHLQ